MFSLARWSSCVRGALGSSVSRRLEGWCCSSISLFFSPFLFLQRSCSCAFKKSNSLAEFRSWNSRWSCTGALFSPSWWLFHVCVYNWSGKGSDLKLCPNHFDRVSVAETACVHRGARLGGRYRSWSTLGSERERSLRGQKGARVGADLPAAPGSLSAPGRPGAQRGRRVGGPSLAQPGLSAAWCFIPPSPRYSSRL